MLDFDVIESQFRAAVRVMPKLVRPSVRRVLVVTDLEPEPAAGLGAQVQGFLRVLDGAEYVTLARGDYYGIRGLLGKLEAERPDLIVTFRSLFEAEKDLPHTLGSYVDMLTQATTTPVLLLPSPTRPNFEAALTNTDRVMVLTDHLVGQDALVSWGLRLVESGGCLQLVHIEDDRVFARYLDAISKIPGLDTELAETAIEARLLSEAKDYAEAVQDILQKEHPEVQLKTLIRRGHTVRDVRAIAEDEACDVVVMNTKDQDQLAMAGKAYSLAVELLDKPLLLL
ncbi:MAG: universal stress protein [Deltaproteobacteria bacterium]|nr:universal stress protein [Deltaproteobacteria bacterium]